MVERLAPRLIVGGPAEPVDGDRVDAPLREPQRELLVERMEAANVGQKDDSGSSRLRWPGPEGREPIAVGCSQLGA